MDFKGMSIDDIRNLDTRKLSTKELKQATNRLVSASNKRVRRLLSDEYGQHSQTAQRAMDRGGQLFSTKGLDTRAKVKAEFDRARSFLDPAKTSHTVRGWRKTIKKMKEKGLSDEMIKSPDFWALFRKFKSEYVPAFFDSYTFLQVFARAVSKGLNTEEQIREFLNKAYEEMYGEDEEDYFSDAEDEFGDYFE